MQPYLRSTEIIDHGDAAIRKLASQLADHGEPISIATRSFHWVRDNIRHSIDHGDSRVTIVASDVLRHGTGLCYAKSHLLAALLRANRIPCGFVYQRLRVDASESLYCLHGLNAVWLAEFGWYRMDARGNRTGIKTSFEPPTESFAFAADLPGESIASENFPDPLPVVIATMLQCNTVSELCTRLPDWRV